MARDSADLAKIVVVAFRVIDDNMIVDCGLDCAGL